jgi:hypothetical protein
MRLRIRSGRYNRYTVRIAIEVLQVGVPGTYLPTCVETVESWTLLRRGTPTYGIIQYDGR